MLLLSANTTYKGSTPESAARSLEKRLGLPASRASVLIWNDDSEVYLKVWLDESLVGKGVEVPSKFHGYRVVVDTRPRFYNLNL